MKTMTTTDNNATTGRTEMEIEIDAAPTEVWSAYVNELPSWWPKDFLATGSEGSMKFEAQAGGRLIETHDNGSGVVWATVLAMETGKSIDLVSHLAENYGGPATEFHRLVFTDNGNGGTTLRVSDCVVGAIKESLTDDLEGGWKTIYGSLREFATRSTNSRN
jgi:uncharacterized protein YndB with AHSA1/START domain